MDDSEKCSCFDSSAVKADVGKLELGPAYYDYKAGKHIPSHWEPDIDFIKDGWLPKCCATDDPDYMLGDDSKLHYGLLAAWCALSIVLFGYFYRHREEQPFKFRDWRVVSLMYINMAFMMFCYTFNYTMDRTASTTSNLFVTFVGLPTQVGYYILKSFQLLYIYKWNELKHTHKDIQTLQLFKKFRFVLTTKFFVIGFFTFVAVGCGLAIGQMQYPVYKDAVSDQFTATTRCYFWQFDEKYQTPTTEYIPMCDCFFYTAYNLQDYEEKCQMAQFGLIGPCLNPETATETELEICQACIAGTEQDCLDWFTEYFVAGKCGQQPKVPRTSTCTYAIPASRPTMYTAGGYISLLLLINLLLILPICFKIDQFGMIFENMLVFAGLGTCLGIYNAGLLILDFYESWDDLSPDYSLTFLLFWVENWWCMVTTLGCAAVHYIWARYRRQRRHFITKRRKSLENGAAAMMKIFKREDNWSAMSAVDELDAELEFWLKHKPVREHYKQFAIEEFTAENPAFLAECYEYLLEVWEALKQPTLSLMLTMMAEGQKLSDKYVVDSAPMEVNLSARTKKKVAAALDDSTVHFDSDKLNVVDEKRSSNNNNNNSFRPLSEHEDSRILSQGSNYESQGPESESERMDDTDVIESMSDSAGTPSGGGAKKRDSDSGRKQSSKRRIFSRRSDKSSTSSNLSEEDSRAQKKLKELEDAFLQALNDIRDLVTRDSWPRFRDSRHYAAFQILYENENKLNAQVETVTSTRFDARPTNDVDGEPRESFFQRVRSFSARKSLNETRPSSFVVVNHTPQLSGDGTASPATDGSRRGTAGEAIATKFMGSNSSFRVARVPSVQEENNASLDIDDSSL